MLLFAHSITDNQSHVKFGEETSTINGFFRHLLDVDGGIIAVAWVVAAVAVAAGERVAAAVRPLVAAAHGLDVAPGAAHGARRGPAVVLQKFPSEGS